MIDVKMHQGSLVANVKALRKSPIDFFSSAVEKYGDFCCVDFVIDKYFVINDPDLIRQILVENSEKIVIKGGVSTGLARLIGHGILTNRGQDWRQSRTALQPLFQNASLENYSKIIERNIGECLGALRQSSSESSHALGRIVFELVLKINCECLFNYRPTSEESENFGAAVWEMQATGLKRNMLGLDFFNWVPWGGARKISSAKRTLFDFAKRVRASGAPQSEDEILSLLFAGTEAPAVTLGWAVILLEQHKEWRSQALESEENVSKFLAETMRLYPAGWAFERCVETDTKIGNTLLKKGARIVVSPYLLHRNPRFWSSPNSFDPSRFAGGVPVDAMAKKAYLPFGMGPRSCLGSRLATAVMQSFLTQYLRQDFSLQVVSSPGQRAEGSFKLRFTEPLFAKVIQNRTSGIHPGT